MFKLPISDYNKDLYYKYDYLHTNLYNEIKIQSYIKQIPYYLQSFYIFDSHDINESQVFLTYTSHPSNYQLLFSFIFQQSNFKFYIIKSFISILEKLKVLNTHDIYYMNPYPLSYFIKNNTDIYLSNFSYSFLSKKKKKFLKKIPFLKNMNNDYPFEIHLIYNLIHHWDTLDMEKIYNTIKNISLEN